MKKSLGISTKLIVTVSSLVSIILLVFVAITANFYMARMSENNNELYQVYTVSEQLKSLRSNIRDFDLRQRNYLLTGDQRFLEQYQQNETEVKTLLKSAESYFAGHPEYLAFEKLRELTYKKMLEKKDLKSGINTLGDAGKNDMDDINEAIDDLNNKLSLSTQELIGKNVHYLNVSKNWSLLQIAFGVLIAIAGITILFRDINLRNKLEEELVKAKKQAEDNALLKEQFMANVSHEIRTPMNAILGFSDLLAKTALSADQAGHLKAISASSSNLLNLINDILDFSKIEAGKLQIEKIPFAMQEVMSTLGTMFSERSREKNLDFTLQCENTIPPLLYGDPVRLTQILVNLINNAVKFTDKGYVKLNVELKSIELGIAQVVMRVKDSGIGIAPDKLNEVFERFNQGNSETTRKYGGTGLGLAIVKSLVELQNGSIYAKSKPGVGTEFVVTLSYPVAQEEIRPGGENTNELPRIAQDTDWVLLVEDNYFNQQLAGSHLKNFGFNVDVAPNGSKALEMLRVKKYRLIFMDIQMPVMDGYHATEVLRTDLKLDTPVIAMTAHVIDGEKEKCLQFGMNDYLSKPFREIQLYEMCKKYSAGKRENFEVNANKIEVKNLPWFETKMVDLKEFYALSSGDTNFINEMIEVFIHQNPEDLAGLEKSITTADYESIRHLAHRMKSSVGFMAITPLIAPLNSIEILAEKKNNIKEIQKLFYTIKPGCETAIEELKQVVNQLKKGE